MCDTPPGLFMLRLFVCLRCTFLFFRKGFVAAGNRGLQLPAEREESCVEILLPG